MVYFFRIAPRFVRVMCKYPKAGISFMLRAFDILPGFRRFVQYPKDRVEEKLRLKKNSKSIGHALGDRSIVCSFLGRNLFSFKLTEGEEATADQFFLNRSVRDLQKLLDLAKPYVQIQSGHKVFDPGCGAGRHLICLADTFDCQAIGVDVYKPAVEVAKVANKNKKVTFLAESSIAPGFLERILPDGCDVVFINSWLNHVKDFDGYHEFSTQIFDKCKFLLVITTAKDDLNSLFDNPKILAHKEDGGTHFAIIQGHRK